jgi:uncharacterized protein YqgV (UPF0045/DUF77 family)
MITAEVAVYPLKTSDATKVINDSINVLQGSSVEYRVNSMNTILNGERDAVFNSIEAMFDEAERSGGEVNMVVTIGNCSK